MTMYQALRSDKLYGIGKRRCIDCKLIKSHAEFSRRKNRSKNNGYIPCSVCKKCMLIRWKKWLEKNSDRYNAYQRKRYYAKK